LLLYWLGWLVANHGLLACNHGTYQLYHMSLSPPTPLGMRPSGYISGKSLGYMIQLLNIQSIVGCKKTCQKYAMKTMLKYAWGTLLNYVQATNKSWHVLIMSDKVWWSYTTRKFHKSFKAMPNSCLMKNKVLSAWPRTLFFIKHLQQCFKI